jgi:hypothetical protein
MNGSTKECKPNFCKLKLKAFDVELVDEVDEIETGLENC